MSFFQFSLNDCCHDLINGHGQKITLDRASCLSMTVTDFKELYPTWSNWVETHGWEEVVYPINILGYPYANNVVADYIAHCYDEQTTLEKIKEVFTNPSLSIYIVKDLNSNFDFGLDVDMNDSF